MRLVMVGPFSVCQSTRPSAMGWPQIDANWDKRQPSEAWQCTESTLRVVRKMLQWCTNEIWKAGVDKSRARVRAIGLKSHVSSSATLGRIFWRNADLGTFTKFSRGKSRTFNQVVPKRCQAKCTHRHRLSHSEVVVVLHGLKQRHDGNGASAALRLWHSAPLSHCTELQRTG